MVGPMKKSRGFTVILLLLGIFVVGLMIALVVSASSSMRAADAKKAQEAMLQADKIREQNQEGAIDGETPSQGAKKSVAEAAAQSQARRDELDKERLDKARIADELSRAKAEAGALKKELAQKREELSREKTKQAEAAAGLARAKAGLGVGGDKEQEGAGAALPWLGWGTLVLVAVVGAAAWAGRSKAQAAP